MSIPDRVPVRRLLVSVFDKANLADLVSNLEEGAVLYSTGGTLQALEAIRSRRSLPFEIVAISDYTGHPEMPGGLVKTLHPKIHAGILAEPGSAEQSAYLAAIEAWPFDMVVCNLYPFRKVASTPGATIEDLRRNIDIGGPTMLRAAAKNFLRVSAVVDPGDYVPLAAEIRSGGVSRATRLGLAKKAFDHVRDYDQAICDALAGVEDPALVEAYATR